MIILVKRELPFILLSIDSAIIKNVEYKTAEKLGISNL